jgi:hypothetical protein
VAADAPKGGENEAMKIQPQYYTEPEVLRNVVICAYCGAEIELKRRGLRTHWVIPGGPIVCNECYDEWEAEADW